MLRRLERRFLLLAPIDRGMRYIVLAISYCKRENIISQLSLSLKCSLYGADKYQW